MSVSLAVIITDIEIAAQAASAVKTVGTLTIEAATAIYSFTKDMIVTAEGIYANSLESGESKLAAVLAAVSSFVDSMSSGGWALLKTQITAFVEGCISMWNTLSKATSQISNSTIAAA